jgi:hypothetical protein
MSAGNDAGTRRNNVFPTERQLVLTAPSYGARHRPNPIVIAKMPSRRRGVTTMNSLIPMMGSMVESRMEEHLARAERERMLRAAGHNDRMMSPLRRIVGAMLVRMGERLAPAHRPAAEPINEPALIRLAR